MKNSTRWIRVWIVVYNILWLSVFGGTCESTLSGQVISGLLESEQESHGQLQVEGTVFDPSDRPVSDARIVVYRFDSIHNFDEYLHHDVKHSEHDVSLAEGQTDKAGVFRLPYYINATEGTCEVIPLSAELN